MNDNTLGEGVYKKVKKKMKRSREIKYNIVTELTYRNVKKQLKISNEAILDNSKIQPKIGYIVEYRNIIKKRFTVISTPVMHDKIINDLNCIVITNQKDYDRYRSSLDVIISTEPGWSAPFLELDLNNILGYMKKSDPHKNPDKFYNYFNKSKFDFMMVPYFYPTLYYFKELTKYQLFYQPWSVPESYFSDIKITNHDQDYILLFGAFNHEIYKTRNWCRNFDFVNFKHYSGVENKKLFGNPYIEWLSQYNAAIAATSVEKQWRYTVAKYFEIVAAGALLFAQETDDMEMLGFKDYNNCLIFNEQNFERKAKKYLVDTDAYTSIRKNGFSFIKNNHTTEIRIKELKNHILSNL